MEEKRKKGIKKKGKKRRKEGENEKWKKEKMQSVCLLLQEKFGVVKHNYSFNPNLPVTVYPWASNYPSLSPHFFISKMRGLGQNIFFTDLFIIFLFLKLCMLVTIQYNISF